MVDPGGEDRVGAGGIGSDGRRASGRWSVGSMPEIGPAIGSGSGMIRSVEIKRHKRVRETVIRRRRRRRRRRRMVYKYGLRRRFLPSCV